MQLLRGVGHLRLNLAAQELTAKRLVSMQTSVIEKLALHDTWPERAFVRLKRTWSIVAPLKRATNQREQSCWPNSPICPPAAKWKARWHLAASNPVKRRRLCLLRDDHRPIRDDTHRGTFERVDQDCHTLGS